MLPSGFTATCRDVRLAQLQQPLLNEKLSLLIVFMFYGAA
jgi:hypothetical protein